MAHTYCMTSNCPLAAHCGRFEDDAARHSLHRTYADFSEELIRHSDSPPRVPFFHGQAHPRRWPWRCPRTLAFPTDPGAIPSRPPSPPSRARSPLLFLIRSQ